MNQRIKLEIALIKWKIKDFFNNTIARHIVRCFPNKIKYWVIIDVWARATTSQFTDKSPDEVTWNMALGTLEASKNESE